MVWIFLDDDIVFFFCLLFFLFFLKNFSLWLGCSCLPYAIAQTFAEYGRLSHAKSDYYLPGKIFFIVASGLLEASLMMGFLLVLSSNFADQLDPSKVPVVPCFLPFLIIFMVLNDVYIAFNIVLFPSIDWYLSTMSPQVYTSSLWTMAIQLNATRITFINKSYMLLLFARDFECDWLT